MLATIEENNNQLLYFRLKEYTKKGFNKCLMTLKLNLNHFEKVNLRKINSFFYIKIFL